MRTLRYIGLLLLIPLLDAILLVAIAAWGFLGPIETVALVVLTGLVGMFLVRAEGRRTIRKIQRKLAEGKPPTDELMDGGLLIAAGAFLLTPGFVTDALGVLLTIPITRVPIRVVLKKYVVTPYIDEQVGGMASGNVWTYGFPEDEDPFENVGGASGGGGFGGGPGPGDAGGSSTDDDVYDLGDDAYDIEFEDKE
ncbi:FxsA family protein [Haloarchaeobius baliensis]|uniref:FxsA family protein n=1 Tax=Haloarchaeobius baliensis TaxID=1670458 RepID=UPI003F8821E9